MDYIPTLPHFWSPPRSLGQKVSSPIPWIAKSSNLEDVCVREMATVLLSLGVEERWLSRLELFGPLLNRIPTLETYSGFGRYPKKKVPSDIQPYVSFIPWAEAAIRLSAVENKLKENSEIFSRIGLLPTPEFAVEINSTRTVFLCSFRPADLPGSYMIVSTENAQLCDLPDGRAAVRTYSLVDYPTRCVVVSLSAHFAAGELWSPALSSPSVHKIKQEGGHRPDTFSIEFWRGAHMLCHPDLPTAACYYMSPDWTTCSSPLKLKSFMFADRGNMLSRPRELGPAYAVFDQSGNVVVRHFMEEGKEIPAPINFR